MEDGDGALFGGKTSGELERTQVSELGSFFEFGLSLRLVRN